MQLGLHRMCDAIATKKGHLETIETLRETQKFDHQLMFAGYAYLHGSEPLADQDAKCSSGFFHLFKEDCIELCSMRALQNVSEETVSSTAGNSFL